MIKRSQLTMAVAAALLGGLSQAYAADQLVVDTNKIGLATTAVLHELAGNLNPDGTIINGSLQAIITAADAAVLNPPTANLLADIDTVDKRVLPEVAIPASALTSAIPANTNILSDDIGTVNGFVLPAAPIPASATTSAIAALTNVLGADVGTVDAYLLPQNGIALSPTTAAIPPRTGNVGADIGVVDGCFLPENPIPASGSTAAVPARVGVMGTDCGLLDALILPDALIPASATTAQVPARSASINIGTDVGVVGATFLAVAGVGFAPARSTNLGQDSGLVDALILPQNAIAGAAGTTGAVTARTGVLGTDLNDLKGKLGVGGSTSLGEDIGTLMGNIASDATNPASDTIQEAINVVDAKLLPAATVAPVIVAWANPQIPALAGRDVGVTARTGILEDDTDTILASLGGAGTVGERIRNILNIINQNAAAALVANGNALPNGYVDLTTAANQLF